MQLLLLLSGRPVRVNRENPLHWLGMQVALMLGFWLLLLVPVGLYRLNWFFSGADGPRGRALFPVCVDLRDAHVSVSRGNSGRYGHRVAVYFPETFSLGALVTGLALFAFAWMGAPS
jgi:hypothetical protein